MNAARDPRIDGLKGALILLVVFGHLIEPGMLSSSVFKATWCVIYLFHMPLFVLVSGMYAKKLLGERDLRAIAGRIVAPLLLFQFLYLAAVFLAKGRLETGILQPYWTLWFLLSLASWKLMLPLLVTLRFPLIISVSMAVLAGYSAEIGYGGSLSRTLYFLPFFVFGHLYGAASLRWAAENRLVCAVLLMVPATLVAGLSHHGLNTRLLLGSLAYQFTGPHALEPGAERVLFLGLSLMASLGFAGLFMRPGRLTAYLGRRTLTIFVSHGFVVLAIGNLAAVAGLRPGLLLLGAYALLSLAIAAALAPLDRPLVDFLERLTSGRRGAGKEAGPSQLPPGVLGRPTAAGADTK